MHNGHDAGHDERRRTFAAWATVVQVQDLQPALLVAYDKSGDTVVLWSLRPQGLDPREMLRGLRAELEEVLGRLVDIMEGNVKGENGIPRMEMD